MDAPLALLKFVAKASLNAVGGGVAGDFVVEVLPGIARDVWGWWGKDKTEALRRADVQALAAVPSGEMSKAIKQVVAEVAADAPAETQARLANFIHMVPGAIQASLRRPGDPRGLTVPANLPLQRAEDLLPFLPQRLPRFKPGDRPLLGVDRELVRLLGVGGFGEVWRARNPHVPNMPDVALKFCLDPAAREQLLKHEAGVLNRVMSAGARPGIVQLRQTYLSAASPCLEYEFIDGGDLTSAIYAHQASKGPLTPEMATKIVFRLARTVGQVHKLSPPIVHRDLKPANVLVRKREGTTEFLITDFGIGGVVASQALEQTRSGGTSQPMMTALKGSHTPLYASPEQKKGEAADPRDDVHAMGVIWYQLLLGDFSEGAPAGGAWRRDLRQRGVSDNFLDLLESCFEAKASDRPPDAAVVAEQIDRIRKANDSVHVGGTSPPPVVDASAQTPGGPAVPPANPLTDNAPDPGPIIDLPPDPLAQAAAALARDDFGAAIRACNQALKATPPPLEAYRLRAQAHAAKEKFDRALEDINTVIASRDATSADFVERGRLFVQKGKTNKAVLDFTQALTRHQQFLPAYFARAQAYVTLGSMELAFADFDAALKIAPQSAEVLYHRAEAQLSRCAYEPALADFNEAIRLQPGNARCYVGRGRIYLTLGQTQQALGDFIQATHTDPECAEAYFHRGVIHAQLGQDAQAVEDFNNATRLDKRLTPAYAHRARANARLGHYAKAEGDFKRTIQKSPRDAMLYVERGDLHAARGNEAGALEDYSRAVKVDKNLSQAHLRRGLAYLRTGQYAYAATSFTRTLELAPNEMEARARRGLALAHKGQFDEALADAEECFSRNHNLAVAHNVRGLVQAGKKAIDPALVDLSEAIRLDPKSAAFRADRGLIHYAQGNYDVAISDFKEAIKLEPKEASHYSNRAKAYEKKGEKEKAQADRQKAAGLFKGTKKEMMPVSSGPLADTPPDAPVETPTTSQPAHEGDQGDDQSGQRKAPAASVTLSDLIAASVLTPPLRLFRRYKGKDLMAAVLGDGTVEFGEERYDSCSSAAEHARSTVTGRLMSTNGWTFWKFLGPDDKPHVLDVLRQRCVNLKAGVGPKPTTPGTDSERERLTELRRAAEQGLAMAQCQLGARYLNGEGVPADEAEAVRWYRLAAEQGNAEAELAIGRAYGSGRGVPRDEPEAVRWYRLAAERGHAEAQCRLGWMLEKGKGVVQNLTEAIRWYTLSAEQGNTTALNRVSCLKSQA